MWVTAPGSHEIVQRSVNSSEHQNILERKVGSSDRVLLRDDGIMQKTFTLEPAGSAREPQETETRKL